jgi:hypothetical protein
VIPVARSAKTRKRPDSGWQDNVQLCHARAVLEPAISESFFHGARYPAIEAREITEPAPVTAGAVDDRVETLQDLIDSG